MGISIKDDLNEEHFNGEIVNILDHDEDFFDQCKGSKVDLAIIILPDTGSSGLSKENLKIHLYR